MKLTADNTRFDELQIHVLHEIVASIVDGLHEAGVTDSQVLHEATGNIAFAIATIIDGSRVMNLEGDEVVPVLTFARERDGPELIGAQSGGSWMSEYVPGVVDEQFKGDDDEFDESIDIADDDPR